MKGNQDIIQVLNEILTLELTSVNQYFLHGQMYENFGLTKLAERIAHESQDERDHAKIVIDRILFLEGNPDLQSLGKIEIGKNAPDMLQKDLDLELKGRDVLLKAIALCEDKKDYQTRELVESLLKDSEEDHIFWLESQLKLIKAMGLENYLAEQIA